MIKYQSRSNASWYCRECRHGVDILYSDSDRDVFGVCANCFGEISDVRPQLTERDNYTERTWYGWWGVRQLLMTTPYGPEYQRMVIDLLMQIR